MFGLFKRSSSGGGPKPTLDAIRFETAGCEFRGEPEPGRTRVWFTPDGDGLGLYLFTIPPDLPLVRTVDGIRNSYQRGLEASGGLVVELSVLKIGASPAVRAIVKTPQQPSGMTYVGSITLPFRDFSFVIKVQCAEHGMTGLRETVLLDRGLQSGATMSAGAAPDSDAPAFDAEFPDHPVSRVRRALRGVCGSLVINPDVAAAPAFPLPNAT